MKKVVLGLFLLGLFSLFFSCQSTQGKAEAFVQEIMQKRLNDPSSYEPVETQYDSVYYSIIFDEDIQDELDNYQDLCLELEELEENLTKLKDEIEYAENDYIRDSDSYRDYHSSFMKSILRESKYELDKKKETQQELNAKKMCLKDSIESYEGFFKYRYEHAPESYFYGWMIVHSFRLALPNGGKFLKEVCLITNKDMDELLVDDIISENNMDIFEKSELLMSILGVETLFK